MKKGWINFHVVKKIQPLLIIAGLSDHLHWRGRPVSGESQVCIYDGGRQIIPTIYFSPVFWLTVDKRWEPCASLRKKKTSSDQPWRMTNSMSWPRIILAQGQKPKERATLHRNGEASRPEGNGVDSYSAGLQINQQLCPDYKELSLKTMDSAQTMLMPKAT